MLFSNKRHPLFFQVQFILGTILSLISMLFHVNNQYKQDALVIDFSLHNTKLCYVIASAVYASSFSYSLSNIIYFLHMLLKFKYALDRDKQLCKKHCIAILVIGGATICGIGVLFNDNLSALCLIQFNNIGKGLFAAVSIIFVLVLVIIIRLSLHQIKTARRNSGRSKSVAEKQLEKRLYSYACIAAASCIMGIIHYLNISTTIEMQSVCLFSHLLLMPTAFPILFALSTRRFRQRKQ